MINRYLQSRLPLAIAVAISSLAAPSYGALIVPADKTWPYAVIPYVIDSDVPTLVQQKFFTAVQEIEGNSNVRFIQRQSHNASLFPDFKRIAYDPNASSSQAGSIGRAAGETTVVLGQNLTSTNTGSVDYGLRTLVHELGHVVGLYHENSRRDMWDYFTIDWSLVVDSNCPDARETNLIGTPIGGYDYYSIMDHSPPFCAVNEFGGPSLAYADPIDANISWQDAWVRGGLAHHLSPGDIDGIDALYPAPAWLAPGLTLGMSDSPFWDYDGIVALIWMEDSEVQTLYEMIDGQAVAQLPGYNRGETVHYGSGYNVVHINALAPGEHTYRLLSCNGDDCVIFERSLLVAH